MSSPGSRHITDSPAGANPEDQSEVRVGTSGGNEVGNVSGRYPTREVTANGSPILQEPLGQILWLFLFDAIHHNGQLSTYLRPFGAKVPSIYGNAGDESA
jgi:hypothetical protein